MAASTDKIREVVEAYVRLVADGKATEVADLYADDATVEDPVGGGEVHIGRQAIAGFYRTIENAERSTELLTLRVAGHEAAFLFAITVGVGGHGLRIEPIDVMVFDDDGMITSMKAYWSAADATPV